jgi:hypothetical protein
LRRYRLKHRWIITPIIFNPSLSGSSSEFIPMKCISALNTKHRDGFNKMVQDALDGKINEGEVL